MSDIFLPSLIEISIKNFSLYPNNGGLDFTYNFKNGLNLIVGGNGTGKTTLTKLIKFGLIGHYREATDVRIYKEERKQKRPEYPKYFYRNRMNPSYEANQSAEITLKFKIKNIIFSITRNIYEIKVLNAHYIENGKRIDIQGESISQDKYEKLSLSEKKKHLQFNYEALVTKFSGISSFDGVIFFVNEILYFGEERKLILWDWDIQDELSSKYFNDPKKDEERTSLKLEQKYKDTQARQTSEEIKAIRDAIQRVESKNINQKDDKNISFQKINDLKVRLDKDESKLTGLQNERIQLTEKRKYLNSSRIKLVQEINELENEIRFEESKVHDAVWRNRNPKYDIYEKHIKNNHTCPGCNQKLTDNKIVELINDNTDCFICHQKLKNSDLNSPQVNTLQQQLQNKLSHQQNLEKDIVDVEKRLSDADTAFNKLDLSIFELRTEIRNIDFEMSQENKNTTTETVKPDNFKRKLELEIKMLEERKKKSQDEGRAYNDQIAKISKEMNDKQAKVLIDLSSIFSNFAGKFLGVKCRLTNDDVIGEKGKKIRVFLPVIGNETNPRIDPDEFSESQRFFVDLAFRMSLLSYFYSQPSFFICETPDSSLDISYERNAANVFLEYMKQDNVLIITSNLNNSDFLSYIAEKSPAINYVNLLSIGRISQIQSSSEILKQTSDKIANIINGRKI